MEAAFDCIVTVYDCYVYVRKCCYELLGCEFLELYVKRILYDVFYCCIDSCIFLKSDDAFLCEEEQSSCFVCYVVRNCDYCAFLKILKICNSSCIDAERFIV